MVHVAINPEIVKWAIQRIGPKRDAIESQYPISDWITGIKQPTLKKLEKFAQAVYVPIGYFFGTAPPDEKITIPDFRTLADQQLARPSPDLLETIQLCERRQEWYREYAESYREPELTFIGSLNLNVPIVSAAKTIRDQLQFATNLRLGCTSYEAALKLLIDKIEMTGVLVMISGIVGSNTYRTLDVNEFRGFALVDRLAPLIFVNGVDSKSAQMFTLAHELAHLWLGQSAIDNSSIDQQSSHQVERWCNQVAAELLVPEAELLQSIKGHNALDQLKELVQQFRVSTIVVLRRLWELKKITRDQFFQAYYNHIDQTTAKPRKTGGNTYRSLQRRNGQRFAKAILSSAFEGQTLFRDAYQLLGIKKSETFQRFAKEMGTSN